MSQSAGRMVLVVDDDATTRNVLAEALSSSAYRVAVAADDRDALQLLAERPADVLLTVSNRPRLDGLGFIRAVRERHPAITVIAMTARAHGDAAAEARLVGADDYVNKPLNLLDVEHRISRALS